MFFMSRYRLICFYLTPIFLTLLGGQTCRAEIFFVVNVSQLEMALAQSAENQESDVIKIATNIPISDTSEYVEISYSLTLETGYFDDFSSRVQLQTRIEPLKSTYEYFMPEYQFSTTGPEPPPGVMAVPSIENLLSETGGTQKTLGVPGYAWRHGCGATALGMVLGYYDVKGVSDLFSGPADTQTESVNQGMASERNSGDPGHYEDYSLPIDNTESGILEDNSELSVGTHTHDCVADFMKTSWSALGLFYGWSYFGYMRIAFEEYASLKVSDHYLTASNNYYFNNNLTWDVLTNEIDNDRPMVFLVDSDGDGNTDHFVTIVGYRDNLSPEYGCLDTWSPYSTIRWCGFAGMASGQPWGIYGGVSFSLAEYEDNDVDGIFDGVDNCPAICNINQLDADDDTIGDVCDSTPGCGGCGESACEVSCDIDNDGILNTEDNCPDLANPNQEDADNDTIGDVCDVDTVYGNISGAILFDVTVSISRITCGDNILVSTTTTDFKGDYSFGNLLNGYYDVVPSYPFDVFSFVPEKDSPEIPQTEIRSYDFTSLIKQTF